MSTKLAGILDKLEKENGATAKYHDGLPRSGVMIEVPVSDPTNLRKGITRSALEFMLKTERNNDNLEWYYTIESRSVESPEGGVHKVLFHDLALSDFKR